MSITDVMMIALTNFDLSDLLIAHSSVMNGCESVITFDKKASKYKLFELA